jgi:tryptophan halogenase
LSRDLKRVVIAGGGPVAWIAAAGLARSFRHRGLEATVVDSGMPGDSPIGRWTLPSQRAIHSLLGIAEPQLVHGTGATFKLATEHRGWQREGSRFVHAHGEIGEDLGVVPFYKLLLLEAIAGRRESPENFSLAAVAARTGRFARPMQGASPLTSSFTYGFHLEEIRYTEFLREAAMRSGVRRVEGAIDEVVLAEDGDIAAMRLVGGTEIAGDLFIDCTGSAAQLLTRIAKGEREDWSRWLPCDRMLSAFAPAVGDAPAITQTIASDAGWLWRAPLADRSMTGFVYSSAFIDDTRALDVLRRHAPALTGTPSLVQFHSGRRRLFWERNCIALGSAAVELEPLAGADLHLAQLGLAMLIELFPRDTGSRVESVEFNRIMAEYADAVRDFTLAHYVAGAGRAGEFWSTTRSVPPPERLAHKLDLFRASGRIQILDHETFEETDWAWLLLGTGCVPEAIEAQVRNGVESQAAGRAAQLRASIERLAATMPPHAEFVRRQGIK